MKYKACTSLPPSWLGIEKKVVVPDIIEVGNISCEINGDNV